MFGFIFAAILAGATYAALSNNDTDDEIFSYDFVTEWARHDTPVEASHG